MSTIQWQSSDDAENSDVQTTDDTENNSDAEDHKCSYDCECPLPWDLDKYGPTEDTAEDDDNGEHETVVVHGRFGTHLRCTKCGCEASGNMIVHLDCEPTVVKPRWRQ